MKDRAVTTKISAADADADAGAVRGGAPLAPKQAQFREIAFASCYVYSPGDASAASRLLCASVKTGNVAALVDQAFDTEDEANQSPSIARFFPAAAILVPVPGSRPSLWSGATPTERLAVALLNQGLGLGIWFGLRRVRTVRKSATAVPGARTSVRTHYDTMAVDDVGVPCASNVILVDDVVTKGRTLLAAALRLREALPRADVRAFALVRTMGYSPVFDQFLMPCTGKIEWKCGDARRSP
jgi:phosphoribosylpyrophosphate synthetase